MSVEWNQRGTNRGQNNERTAMIADSEHRLVRRPVLTVKATNFLITASDLCFPISEPNDGARSEYYQPRKSSTGKE